MQCSKCGFDMTAKVFDDRLTRWTCPLGHTKVETHTRASATHPKRVRQTESTFPDNLEHK